ncbi:MAG: hypothetical protein LZ166_00605 [Thaumarchaeota archaeon]|jgi:hypothetical protein|nr:hypothetical protein [Nitrososphaerota archaeon]MCL7386014.1 hypothetical protein [Candidatus Wolframiiraptor allenii]
MKWEHKKYGRLPSGEELKRVKGELYVSEMIRRNMKKALEMFFEEFLRIGLPANILGECRKAGRRWP